MKKSLFIAVLLPLIATARAPIKDLLNPFVAQNETQVQQAAPQTPKETKTQTPAIPREPVQIPEDEDTAPSAIHYSEPLPTPDIPPDALHTSEPLSDPLSKYPSASHTWGGALNPEEKIPASGFDAYYINTTRPNDAIAQENVPHIAIHYAYDGFHGIPSQDFGAYWVGTINVPEDAPYTLAIDQGWSKTRVILDKRVIYDSDQRGQSEILLPKGEHLLEVEYINNWHTTNFTLSLRKTVPVLDDKTLRAAITQLNLPKNTVVYAAGVYESRNRDNRVILHGAKTDIPAIWILGSYHAVHWEIHGQPPALVIYNNAKSGSTVSSTTNIPLFVWPGSIPYNLAQKHHANCHCIPDGNLHCENNDNLGQAQKAIQNLTGYPLAGVSGTYGAEALTIPETPLTDEILKQNQRIMEDIDAQREACRRKYRETPADIFKPTAADHPQPQRYKHFSP